LAFSFILFFYLSFRYIRQVSSVPQKSIVSWSPAMGKSRYMSVFHELGNFYWSESFTVHKMKHIQMSLPTWDLTE